MGSDADHTPRVQFSKDASEPLMEATVRGKHQVFVDERDKKPPIGSGEDRYPTPVDYMLTSLVACQVAVLTQCLAKARIDEFSIEADADVSHEEAEAIPEEMPAHTGNRIRHVDIDLELTVPAEYETRAARCLEVYDEGCIVGQSFRAGIDYTTSTTFEVVD